MTTKLDLLDIQGNVIRAYGRFGYPVARYVFLNINNAAAGRAFVGAITKKVTTSVDWGTGVGELPQPDWTVNISFTYQGLKSLELPIASLIGFSPEFVEGMKYRKDILGDNGPSAPEHWDPIWQENHKTREKDVHIFVALNARSSELLEQSYSWLTTLVAEYQGALVILGGNLGDNDQLLDERH